MSGCAAGEEWHAQGPGQFPQLRPGSSPQLRSVSKMTAQGAQPGRRSQRRCFIVRRGAPPSFTASVASAPVGFSTHIHRPLQPASCRATPRPPCTMQGFGRGSSSVQLAVYGVGDVEGGGPGYTPLLGQEQATRAASQEAATGAQQLQRDMAVLERHPDRSSNFSRGLSSYEVTHRRCGGAVSQGAVQATNFRGCPGVGRMPARSP